MRRTQFYTIRAALIVPTKSDLVPVLLSADRKRALRQRRSRDSEHAQPIDLSLSIYLVQKKFVNRFYLVFRNSKFLFKKFTPKKSKHTLILQKV